MRRFSFLKYPFRTIFLALAAGGMVFIVIKNTRPASPPERIAVKRGTITEEVTVTGTVKPAQNINLGFTKSGRVKVLRVDVGSTIVPGEILAELDASQLKAQLDQSQAGIASAQAKLDELVRGTRPEQIALSKTQLANAKQAASDTERNLKAATVNAASNADDAVHNTTDVLFSNPRTSPQLVFITTNSQLKNDAERERANIETIFTAWDKELTAGGTIETQAEFSLNVLSKVQNYFDTLSNLVNSLTSGGGLDAATIATYRTNVSLGRTSVNSAITSLAAAQEKMNAASANVLVAENKLAIDEAGATQESIAAAEAVVREAEASAVALKVQLDDLIIRSPLSGTVTKVDIHVGEIVPPNTPVISAISNGALTIESQIPEVDIGKVRRGNSIAVIFDAFPGETFSGKVAYIDPAETIVDGVVNYKITAVLDSRDERLKSGLTANLALQTLIKSGVLLVPQFGILQTDEGTFAQKWVNGTAIPVPIIIGIQSKDGVVEIVSGLDEGDEIVNVGIKSNRE